MANKVKYNLGFNSAIMHLYLGCNAQNFGAVKLYKKCEFKVYGTVASLICFNFLLVLRRNFGYF